MFRWIIETGICVRIYIYTQSFCSHIEKKKLGTYIKSIILIENNLVNFIIILIRQKFIKLRVFVLFIMLSN